MSIKKKISIFCLLICIAAFVFGCSQAPSSAIESEAASTPTPQYVEPPFDEMFWGMPLEEAYALLEKNNVGDPVLADWPAPSRVTELWKLTAEQAEKLGYISPGELEISSERELPVYLGFCSASSEGTPRLVSVSVMAQVPEEHADSKDAKQSYAVVSLSKHYGPEFSGDGTPYWAKGVAEGDEPAYYPHLSAMVDGRTDGQKLLLCYDASSYLTRNSENGGRYYPIEGDLGVAEVVDEPVVPTP